MMIDDDDDDDDDDNDNDGDDDPIIMIQMRYCMMLTQRQYDVAEDR